MDQRIIGSFLRELRRERGLTQEELAERMLVSNRSVSRWETGANLPDVDLLLELAAFYDVDVGEILNGERKGAMEDAGDMELLAEYSSQQRHRIIRRFHWLFIAGLAAALVYTALIFLEKADNFVGGVCHGIVTGMMAVGVFLTGRHAKRLLAIKEKLRS